MKLLLLLLGLLKNVLHKTSFMSIGPCNIVIVDEQKTNLKSLAILFHFLCAQLSTSHQTHTTTYHNLR